MHTLRFAVALELVFFLELSFFHIVIRRSCLEMRSLQPLSNRLLRFSRRDFFHLISIILAASRFFHSACWSSSMSSAMQEEKAKAAEETASFQAVKERMLQAERLKIRHARHISFLNAPHRFVVLHRLFSESLLGMIVLSFVLV